MAGKYPGESQWGADPCRQLLALRVRVLLVLTMHVFAAQATLSSRSPNVEKNKALVPTCKDTRAVCEPRGRSLHEAGDHISGPQHHD